MMTVTTAQFASRAIPVRALANHPDAPAEHPCMWATAQREYDFPEDGFASCTFFSGSLPLPGACPRDERTREQRFTWRKVFRCQCFDVQAKGLVSHLVYLDNATAFGPVKSSTDLLSLTGRWS